MPNFIVTYSVMEGQKSMLEGSTFIFSHSYDRAYLIEAIKKELKNIDMPLKENQTIQIISSLET